jgi:hypothetical protein
LWGQILFDAGHRSTWESVGYFCWTLYIHVFTYTLDTRKGILLYSGKYTTQDLVTCHYLLTRLIFHRLCHLWGFSLQGFLTSSFHFSQFSALYFIHLYYRGMQYRSWLRHYATSRKVAGSIPDEVIGFFQLT